MDQEQFLVLCVFPCLGMMRGSQPSKLVFESLRRLMRLQAFDLEVEGIAAGTSSSDNDQQIILTSQKCDFADRLFIKKIAI